jgi:signal transduction histidine kinase
MRNRCQIDSITVAIDHASAIGALSVRQRAVVIVVADNGYGIPDGLHQTLFDSFKSHKADGYGQGLWVVREIVAGHGATTRYKSSETTGKSGTVFRISLPIQQAA